MAIPPGTYASRLPIYLGQKGGPILDLTVIDPRVVGYDAPVGSRLINATTGAIYDKIGLLATAWKGVGVSLLDASPTDTIDLYVNGETGDDANDGLTALTPKLTIGALRRAYWYQTTHHQQVIVHLAGAAGIAAFTTYTEDSLWIGGGEEALVSSWHYVAPEMNLIFPTSGAASAALDVVPAVRVDQTNAASGTGRRTRLDFTAAAPGWTVNDLVGSFLRVTRAGNKVFFELPITENTADTLTVDTIGIVGVLLAADTVEIVRPAVVIVAPGGGASFGFLTLAGKGSGSHFHFSGQSVFTRIEFGDVVTTGVDNISYDRCLLKGNLSGIFIVADGFAFVNCALWTELALGGSGSFVDSYDPVAPISPTASVTISGCKPATVAPATLPQVIIGVYNVHSTHCTWFVGYPLTVYDANGPAGWGAVTVDVGSQLIMNDAYLGGTRNGRIGLRARRAARVRVGAGVLTTITGIAGSLQVETGAAIAYGAGVGAFEEVLGWNGNFTRMLEGTAVAPTGDVSMITTRAI